VQFLLLLVKHRALNAAQVIHLAVDCVYALVWGAHRQVHCCKQLLLAGVPSEGNPIIRCLITHALMYSWCVRACCVWHANMYALLCVVTVLHLTCSFMHVKPQAQQQGTS
jgi:hypothetical protein